MDGRTARAVKQQLESLADAGVIAVPKAGRMVAAAAATPQHPAAARGGDPVLVMSNGDFCGVHVRLLDALAAR